MIIIFFNFEASTATASNPQIVYGRATMIPAPLSLFISIYLSLTLSLSEC